MNSSAFNTFKQDSFSPFTSFNSNNKASTETNESQKNGILSGLTGLMPFSSGKGDTLPFSYADASHTKTTSNTTGVTGSNSSASTWLPTFLTNPTGGSSTNLATSTSLTPTQEWLETLGGLSRTQRYTAFGICIAAAVFLFFLALLHLPFVVIRPGKFIVPYCMASMFILVSFGFLHGFVSYTKHLFSAKKVVYSAWFILATFATLYASISLKSYILTVIMALIQMAGMITFIVSYVPGGSSGINFMSTMITSSIKSRFSPNSF